MMAGHAALECKPGSCVSFMIWKDPGASLGVRCGAPGETSWPVCASQQRSLKGTRRSPSDKSSIIIITISKTSSCKSATSHKGPFECVEGDGWEKCSATDSVHGIISGQSPAPWHRRHIPNQ